MTAASCDRLTVFYLYSTGKSRSHCFCLITFIWFLLICFVNKCVMVSCLSSHLWFLRPKAVYSLPFLFQKLKVIWLISHVGLLHRPDHSFYLFKNYYCYSTTFFTKITQNALWYSKWGVPGDAWWCKSSGLEGEVAIGFACF